MQNVLFVSSSLMSGASISRKIAGELVQAMQTENPDLRVTERDLTPVSAGVVTPLIVCVLPSSPIRTLKDLIEAGRQSDGLFNFNDILPTALGLAGASELLPTDRYIDGIDQTSFLLAPDGLSNRKYHYYWLSQTFSAMRCGEYKMVLSAVGDAPTDSHGVGGFTGTLDRFAYPKQIGRAHV